MAEGNSRYDHFLYDDRYESYEDFRGSRYSDDRYSSAYTGSYGRDRMGSVYSDGSAARDYMPGEEPETEKAPAIDMKKSPPKRASVVKVVFIAVSAMALISSVLYGKVQTNKLYTQIADKNTSLELAQSENVRLRSELEGRMTLKNVEDYAENVLGLQKLDNSQIKYVQTQTDDSVQITEEEKGIWAGIKSKFSRVVEYIFG